MFTAKTTRNQGESPVRIGNESRDRKHVKQPNTKTIMKSQMVKHPIQHQVARDSIVKDSIVKFLCTTVILVAFGTAAFPSGAAESKHTGIPAPAGVGVPEQKPGVIAKKEDPNGRLVPFHGKLDSVDKTAKSIKSGERTFQVMPTTKITKDGVQPGTLEDAKVGESIGGAYREGDGGKYQLVSLRLGPKPEKKTAAARKK